MQQVTRIDRLYPMVLRHLQTGLPSAASNLGGRSSSDARRIGYARSCADNALQWRVVILIPALLLIMVAVAAEAPGQVADRRRQGVRGDDGLLAHGQVSL